MAPTTQQTFGARLALLRAANGLSQEQVAQVLNVSRSTYSYYESGKSAPSLDNLRNLVRLFCPNSPSFLLLLDLPPVPSKEDLAGDLLHDDGGNPETVSVPMQELSRNEKQLVAFYRVFSEAQKKKLLSVCCDLAAAPFGGEGE